MAVLKLRFVDKRRTIRWSRFTREQTIGVLKEHQEGATAADLCRNHGKTHAMFYTWGLRYGAMEVEDVHKLKAAGGRAPQAQEAAGGADAGPGNAEGDAGKKLLTPGSWRAAVA